MRSRRRVQLDAKGQHRARDRARRRRGDEGAVVRDGRLRGLRPRGRGGDRRALTDNRNRTAADVRHIFTKHGGNLGAHRSRRLAVRAARDRARRPRGRGRGGALLAVADAGADDIEQDGSVLQVSTTPERLQSVRQPSRRAGFAVESAELTMVPKVTVEIEKEATAQSPAPGRGPRGQRRRPGRLRELRHLRGGAGGVAGRRPARGLAADGTASVPAGSRGLARRVAVRSAVKPPASPSASTRDGCVRLRDRPRKRRRGSVPWRPGAGTTARSRAPGAPSCCGDLTTACGAVALHEPDAAASRMVRPSVSRRPHGALRGQARGAVMVAAATRGRRVTEYAPNTIKQSVCGHGRADKGQVQRDGEVLLALDADAARRRTRPTRWPPRSAIALDAAARRGWRRDRAAPWHRRPARAPRAPPRGGRRRLPRGRHAGRAEAADGGGEPTVETFLHVREDALSSTASPTPRSASSSTRPHGQRDRSEGRAGRRLRARPPRSCAARSRSDDSARSRRSRGIGKRTAERIVLELKDKIVLGDEAAAAVADGTADPPRRARRAGRARLSVVEAEQRAGGRRSRAAPGGTGAARVARRVSV